MTTSRKMMGAAAVASTLIAVVPARADVAIGILIPSSGKGASYGQQQQNAINMFLEKYADLGGKAGKMKLVIYDTRGENTDAINLTRRLIDSDQVVAIVGPQFSAEAEVAFPLAVRGETPMVTPMAAKAGIAAANRPWAFRFALTTENVYRPLLEIWLKKQQSSPIKKVVIFMDAKDAVSSFDGKTIFPKLLNERRHRGPRHSLVSDRRHRLFRAGHARQGAQSGRVGGIRALQRSGACRCRNSQARHEAADHRRRRRQRSALHPDWRRWHGGSAHRLGFLCRQSGAEGGGLGVGLREALQAKAEQRVGRNVRHALPDAGVHQEHRRRWRPMSRPTASSCATAGRA